MIRLALPAKTLLLLELPEGGKGNIVRSYGGKTEALSRVGEEINLNAIWHVSRLYKMCKASMLNLSTLEHI